MRNADPHRVALLRDLLLDYPSEKPSNHGEPPEGLTPDEQDAWVEDFMMRNGSDLPLEGRYPNAEMGQPAVTLSPMGNGAWGDVQTMRERLARILGGGNGN